MRIRESTLQKKILKDLRLKGGFWINTHGSPMQMRGLPDIVGCYGGKFFGFEVKRPGAVLTPLQAFAIEKIQEAGGVASQISSFEEAEALLDGTVD